MSIYNTTVIKSNLTMERKAILKFDTRGPLNDIRLGRFLSIVDSGGDMLRVIRKSDLKSHIIYLERSDFEDPSSISKTEIPSLCSQVKAAASTSV